MRVQFEMYPRDLFCDGPLGYTTLDVGDTRGAWCVDSKKVSWCSKFLLVFQEKHHRGWSGDTVARLCAIASGMGNLAVLWN